MTPHEKIARLALAVMRSGPVEPCIPRLAARRTATASPRSRFVVRDRLTFESGGVPVTPPSARRELQI